VVKSRPTWTDVKAELAGFDRLGLISLIRDLYVAHTDNQTFLHTRFGLAEDALQPYKAAIELWIYPDVFGPGDMSISKAKKAISDYKKAFGQSEGFVELMVYYCELAGDFCYEFGLQDAAYLNALVRMFEKALQQANTLPSDRRDVFIKRLERVRLVAHGFGYGVGEDLDALLEGTDDEN
jgi:hypothetical protein